MSLDRDHVATLSGRSIKVHFGGVKAVDGVDITFEQDEILGVIGPNGSGKTTLINALSGFQELTDGSIRLDGDAIDHMSPRMRARAGIARTFQRARLFTNLPVLENVEVAATAVGARGAEARRVAEELLERFGLQDKARRLAGELTHGEERLLGVARALGGRPRFALLDEPAAGLNEEESEQLLGILRSVHEDYGCGLLVVEHDMSLIMRLCDRLQVMNQGTTIAVGTPAEVRADQGVIDAYLGTAADNRRSAQAQLVIDTYLGHGETGT